MHVFVYISLSLSSYELKAGAIAGYDTGAATVTGYVAPRACTDK